MEKAREHQRDLYMCVIDYKKAFDCVDHEIRWVILGDGSASTPDSVTEKAVHEPGSDSQNGVWRDRQHRHWENGMDTGVKGAKGCFKLFWARGESRRDGR